MIPRLLGFCVGLVTVLAIVALVPHNSRVLAVLAEDQGALRTVEIQYTRAAAPRTWRALRAFLSAIGPKVKVVAVCGDNADAADLRFRWPGDRFQIVVVGAPITAWSKDRFLVAPGRLICPRLVPSPLGTRGNDALVAPTISRSIPGYRVEQTDLAFDAGDILCTPSIVLVNDEVFAKNPQIVNVADVVAKITGRQVVRLSGSPSHHIGMFAAPLNDRTVVVADPDLGRRLWSELAGRQLGKPDWSVAVVKPFRTAIEDLRAAGFQVVKVPVAPMEPRVYVTYTNAVFEVRDGRKIVYMPTYGVPNLDGVAAGAYRSQGWEVIPIPVSNVFRLCGTIGCLVNVLERD